VYRRYWTCEAGSISIDSTIQRGEIYVRQLKFLLALLVVLSLGVPAVLAQTFRVGDHVEALPFGYDWYPCVVTRAAPNYMVKAIAERSGVALPGFAGYIFKWTIPVLLPLLLVIWLIFFR